MGCNVSIADAFQCSTSLSRMGTRSHNGETHYNDVIMSKLASQITSLTIVDSTVYSDADQRKHQSSASLAFVWGIHRGPVNSPHKWPVTRKMFPFDDVIMCKIICCGQSVIRENTPYHTIIFPSWVDLYVTTPCWRENWLNVLIFRGLVFADAEISGRVTSHESHGYQSGCRVRE